MANYNTNAQVTVTVNGRQANQMMADLEKRSKSLTKAMEAANKAGDKEKLKTLRRELTQVNDAMAKLKGSTATAEEVLKRLDSATPKELNKALRELKRQMDSIERGSDLWKQKAEQIKKVKAEIAALNSELTNSRSRWDRFTDAVNKSGAAIMAGVAAAAGVIAAGKKSVDDFAEMDQQMANVRKYTGQTERQVAAMNEQFKGIDTRSAREELNQLAQQAGRLGKQAQEDVTGFVKAADKINVALDDLGSDATLTISKLTGIFGDEERLGTEKAMLSVGSVINELSQNCAASAPYLAEFASRVGGVGSQANMTIPQIMAFGAVLDSANQNVEASATALSQVIVRIYQEPAKYAKVAGLDIAKFAETVRTDMNGALIELLEALNAAGSMDVLSPMFADMGENGARAISALSTLAARIGEVKTQQEVANQAFKEATSIDKEFNVQNTTLQASLEKSKNRLHEVSVELGEKLAPLMSHIYSSSSALLRVMSTIVSFITSHKTAIINLTAAIVAYTVVSKGAVALTKLHTAAITVQDVAIKQLRVVYILFTRGVTSARAAMRLFNLTLATSPIGTAAAAVGLLAAAIIQLRTRTDEYSKSLKDATKSVSDFSAEINKETRQIDELFGKLEGLKSGTKEYQSVKDTIISKYGQYLNGLINEKNEITNLEEAYSRLAAAARLSAKERAIDKARSSVDSEYDDKVQELSAQLHDQLMGGGLSYKEAVSAETKIAVQMQSSGSIDKDVRDQLLQIALKSKFDPKAPESIAKILQEWETAYKDYKAAVSEINNVDETENPIKNMSEAQITANIKRIKDAINDGADHQALFGTRNDGSRFDFLVKGTEMKEYLSALESRLSQIQSAQESAGAQNGNLTSGYVSEKATKQADKERRKAEAEARRAATKQRKEFKDALNATKGDWESDSAENTAQYSMGLKTWTEYLTKKHDLEVKYFDDRQHVYEQYNLQEDEDYQELLKKRSEMEAKWLQRQSALKVDDAKRAQKAEESQIELDFYTPGTAVYKNEESKQQSLFEVRIKYLERMRAAYNKDSEDWHKYTLQIEDAENAEKLRRQKEYAEKVEQWRFTYSEQSARKRMMMELAMIEQLYKAGLLKAEEFEKARQSLKAKYADSTDIEAFINASDIDSVKRDSSGSILRDAFGNPEVKNAAEKYKEVIEAIDQAEKNSVITAEKAAKLKADAKKKYLKEGIDAAKQSDVEEVKLVANLTEAWYKFFHESIKEGKNWCENIAGLTEAVFSAFNAGAQQLLELSKASAEVEIANVEKKYDREIDLAEGNAYRVKQAEEKKQKEIDSIRGDYSRKQFTVQVIQAIADTASNALKAYGALAAIPVVGPALGAAAAAAAVASGMIQVATLKKQQQAAAAQGYSSGGFTPKGRVDEPVGVVHAGEWVASQRLLANPQARTIIESLDYVQRRNTIGSITSADISGAVVSPPSARAFSSMPVPKIEVRPSGGGAGGGADMSASLRKLNERLEEPFVTVNTVEGDRGINQALEKHNRLINRSKPRRNR